MVDSAIGEGIDRHAIEWLAEVDELSESTDEIFRLTQTFYKTFFLLYAKINNTELHLTELV